MNQSKNVISFFGFALIIMMGLVVSCGVMQDSQFTKKLVSSPFISKVDSSTSKVIQVESDFGDHVAWIGLNHSADYKNFYISGVVAGGREISESVDPDKTVPSFMIVPPANGSANQAGTLKVTVTYKPQKAIESEDKPHRAYLLVAYEKPDLGIVRVELTGYTRGLCNPAIENCGTVDVTVMEKKEYKLKNDTDGDGVGEIELYLCSPMITKVGQNNDEANHADTNLAKINIDKSFVFYFTPDGKSVYFARNDSQGYDPTVPSFKIPVPPGKYDTVDLSNVNMSLDASLKNQQTTQCALGEDGSFNCPGIEMDLNGLLFIDPLTVSNGLIQPETDSCGSFASEGITGSGSFDSADGVKIVAFSKISESPQVPSIEDALIVAVIDLIPL